MVRQVLRDDRTTWGAPSFRLGQALRRVELDSAGTREPITCFGEVGSGLSLGQTLCRSPFDRYRAPGTPAYEG